MTVYNIFYDSNKNIMWSSTAEVTDAIKTEQKTDHNYDHLSVDVSDTPVGDSFYINSDGDAVVAKSTFSPSFNTTTPALDAVVTITGVPAGTEVFIDGTSGGTMSDTTLTLTASEAGSFEVILSKDKYIEHTTIVTVKRYGA
jgi:hypothetical protein